MDRWALLSFIITALAGGSPPAPPIALPGSDCQLVSSGYGPTGAARVRAETVASGLEVPWGIGFLPGGDWLVTERPGRVRLLRDGRLDPEPVMTVSVAEEGEGGLLGIAVHPRFSDNHFFYLYVTAPEKGEPFNRVVRYRLADDHRSATLDRTILDRIPAAPYHDGGRLRFGPDGMLYIGTGDGGVPDRAASRDSLNGKLLRVTPDGDVPADNPFPGSPVFLLGLRNTQGFDWIDRRSLVVTDHGPSGEFGLTGNDEVNIARAGDDLGWPRIHGCTSAPGMITPSLAWAAPVPPGGAALYTGLAIPEWRGSLLIGTLRLKHLHRVVLDPANPRRVLRHEVYFEGYGPRGFGRLREVVMGPDRELYVTTSNCDGRGICPPDKDRILRITR
ncbi:MAG: PQQ-dependent sugar dehydrogenase [Minicystis sp.]